MVETLRLLYVDSAGVRRCRVVVVRGGALEADGAGDGSSSGAAAAWGGAPSGQLAAGDAAAQAALASTPSMILAAGAGAVPPPPGARMPPLSASSSFSNLKSVESNLKPVGENRVLSPDGSEVPSPSQPHHQPHHQPQQQLLQASGSSSSLAPSGAGGLRHSPSMVLAASVGAVSGVDGVQFELYNSSAENSRDASPIRGSNHFNDPAAVQLAQQAQLAAASAAAASAVGGQPGGSLRLSPSMVWAAGAGLLPADAAAGSTASSVAGTSNPPSPLPAGMAAGSAAPSYSPVLLQRTGSGSLPRSGSASRLLMAGPMMRRPSSGRLRGLSPFAASHAAALAALPAVAELSVGLTKACMGHPCFADVLAPGCGLAPVGEVLLVPDLAAAVRVPWCPGSSMAPADMHEKDLSQPWACCPRSALKRALSRLESRHGLTALVGFELEFLLLKPAPLELYKAIPDAVPHLLRGNGQAWVPFDASVYDQTSSIDAAMPVMTDMVSTLEALGIAVIQFHAESAPGQFEVALAPYAALEAADKLVFAREALTAVARQHGLAVCFLPKPLASAAGSGCHMHLSLQRGGSNIMAAAAAGEAAAAPAGELPPACHMLSSTARSFLAGMLAHLPGLLPFTLPSVNSYARLQPGCWSGAHVCWGYENREAPLRVCCPRGGPAGTNVEFKSFDGSTNPYLGLAAALVAGMQGLEDAGTCELPPALQLDPGADASKALPRLPSTPAAALDALRRDARLSAALADVLGGELVAAYLAVRRCEAEASPDVSELLLRY